jgi:hypothetical protein
VRQRAEEFAEGARRLSYALPEAALVAGNPDEGKPRLAEVRKVCGDQSAPLLPLAALRGEVGRHLSQVVQ